MSSAPKHSTKIPNSVDHFLGKRKKSYISFKNNNKKLHCFSLLANNCYFGLVNSVFSWNHGLFN